MKDMSCSVPGAVLHEGGCGSTVPSPNIQEAIGHVENMLHLYMGYVQGTDNQNRRINSKNGWYTKRRCESYSCGDRRLQYLKLEIIRFRETTSYVYGKRGMS